MPKVNPELVKWARETAGLSLEEAARKLKLETDALVALEEGSKSPTRPQLLRMTKQYRRPLLAFYLPAPPLRGERGQDFRTLPDSRPDADDALLDALIRDVLARQSMVRSVLEDEDEASPLNFVGSMSSSDGVAAVCDSIRKTLQVDLAQFRAQNAAEEAFSVLRDGAENVGIFVLLKGDLGNYHTAIDLETFRGFTLADEIAPFVIINDQDSKSAWSFTLLHELTHLWLGQTGVSGADTEHAIERFCNDVASEYLLPAEELLEFEDSNGRPLSEHITEFATARNVSSSMVAYRLYRVKFVDEDTWKELTVFFRSLWLQQRRNQREKARAQESGPNYYVVRRHRLGKALTDLVGRMMSDGTLTTTKAAKVLGVKAKQVQMLIGGRGQNTNRPRA